MIPTPRLPRLLAAGVLSAALLPAGAARADVTGLSVRFEGSPVPIVVHNDGRHFTYATPTSFQYGLTVHAGCQGNELLTAFVATPATNEAWVYKGVSREAATPRGAAVLDVPLDKLFRPPFQHNPVQLCNEELERRVAQGAVKSQVLASGFNLPYPQTVGLAAKCWPHNQVFEANPDAPPPNVDDMRNWKSASDQRIGIIQCQAHNELRAVPPPTNAGNDLAVPFQVSRVTLSTSPTRQTTRCPVELTFTGSIGVVGSGEVRYRINHNGERGPVQTLPFSGTGAEGVSFQVEIDPTPDPGPSGKGSSSGIGGLTVGRTPQNRHNGFVRLEIISPTAGVRHSQDAVYRVDCVNPGSQVAAGGLAAPRRPPAGRRGEIAGAGSKAAALRPDLTSRRGIEIGGRFSPWGGTLELAAPQAISRSHGACVYRYDYDAVNLGTAPAGPFVSRLHDGSVLLAENAHLTLAAGAGRHLGGQLRLAPGSHVVRVVLDEAGQVAESNETNNQLRLRVVVRGRCDGRAGRR